MTKETPMAEDDPKIIYRFPRLPVHEKIAELSQKVWMPPLFSVDEVNGSTRFIFAVPIQANFQKQAPDDYQILFHAKKTTWKEALQRAYLEDSRKNPIKDYINTVLYKLFCEALVILNTDTADLTGDYTGFKEEFVDKFGRASKRKGGRHLDPDREQRAIDQFNRRNILFPRVQELRRFIDDLKRSGVNDEESLRRNVAVESKDDNWISFVISGAAFETLLGDSTHGGTISGTTIAGKWAPWQLTISIIRCEVAAQTPRKCPSLITILKSIMLGAKLNAASSRRKK